MIFKIEITEAYRGIVNVKAESLSEAIKLVARMFEAKSLYFSENERIAFEIKEHIAEEKKDE